MRLETQVPEGIRAEVVLDRDPDKRPTLSHNGVDLDLSDPQRSAQSGVSVEPKLVRVRITSGTHVMELGNLSGRH